MLLIEAINKLFDAIGDLSASGMDMWNQFAKDNEKDIVEPIKSKDTEVLYPKHTYEVWFPKFSPQYKIKIRSRNIKMALTRLLQKYDQIEFHGKTYLPKDYPDLQFKLELTGDFDFKKI